VHGCIGTAFWEREGVDGWVYMISWVGFRYNQDGRRPYSTVIWMAIQSRTQLTCKTTSILLCQTQAVSLAIFPQRCIFLRASKPARETNSSKQHESNRDGQQHAHGLYDSEARIFAVTSAPS
jgi:hypothetical protein